MFLNCGGYTNYAFIRFQQSGEKKHSSTIRMEENVKKEKIEKKERCDDDAIITLQWKNTKTGRCDIQNDIHTKQGTFDDYRNNSLELGTSGISILNVWLVSGISTESFFFFCNVQGRHQCFF